MCDAGGPSYIIPCSVAYSGALQLISFDKSEMRQKPASKLGAGILRGIAGHLLVDLEHLLLAGVQGGPQVAVRHLEILFCIGLLAACLRAQSSSDV